jgi:hypothetical protein
MTAKIVVSASVKLYLNGKPFGKVKDFRYNVSTARKAVYGIDSMEPYELMPTVSRISGTLSMYKTVGDGGAEGAAMVARVEEIPREKYFSIMLVDRTSQTIIFEAKYCSVQSQSWVVSERGIVMGTVDFESLDYNNELRALTV